MQIALALWLAVSAADAPAKDPAKASSSEKAAKASAESSPPLQEAEAALRAGIHKRCVEFAQEALATGALDEDAVARAWWTRGRCHSLDGDKDRAERSYAVAVRVKPNILMPVDDSAFDAVKAEGTAAASALVLDAHTVVVSDIVAVELVVVDDLGLGKSLILLDSDDREVARAPIERAADADASTKVQHRFSGIPVEHLSARLLDKHGNVLRRAPIVVDDAARAALVAAGATPVTPTQASSSSITWLSYAGAGTALAGIVGASASGIALAINTAAEDDLHVIDSEAAFVVGVIAGAAVAVVGGVMVVVDQSAASGG